MSDKPKVRGDFCPRCDKNVKWFPVPDSLASFCEGCGFVRVGFGETDENGTRLYDVGATIQEWLEDVYGAKESEE
jgi:hypothetical protein